MELQGRYVQLQAWLTHLSDDYNDRDFILNDIQFDVNIVNASEIKGYVRLHNYIYISLYDENIRHNVSKIF